MASSLTPATSVDIREELHNFPVWDRSYLKQVYNQLQGLRPYVDFPDIGVDRYPVNGVLKQVKFSGRELNLNKLPDEAKIGKTNTSFIHTVSELP